MRKVRIAIASPSDVAKERDAVLKVFTRWNENNDHAFLHPVMWESASVPELGDHPQHLLNPRIIDKSDLLIAILWSKLGTPTPTAMSGTVEEIREFMAKKGPGRVMIYFCTRDLPYNINPVELAKLVEFQEQIRQKGIYHRYKAVEEFEGELYRHLDTKVDDFLKGRLPLPEELEDFKQKQKALDLHPDKRLHQPIDFGASLEEVARNFSSRIAEFEAIDGCTNDKYYRLGAHVYLSTAESLDQVLTYTGRNLLPQHREVIERISSRLKRLAHHLPEAGSDFRKYWADGRQIADDLTAQVTHLASLKALNRTR